MTQFLNLDDFETKVEKVLKLKGKEHKMAALSVGAFIEQMKTAKALEKSGEANIADFIDHMITMVDNVFPTIGRDELEKLSLDQLNAILDFAKTSQTDGAEATPSKKPVKAKK